MKPDAGNSNTFAPAPAYIPWEDPEQPRISGLVLTVWKLLSKPRMFFANMPRQGWGEALTFGLIVGTFGLLASLYLELLLSLGISHAWQDMPGFSHLAAQGSGAFIVLMLLTPGIILASLLISSGCLWGALKLVGVAVDFPPALRINCYAQGALVICVIPIIGVLIAIFWNIFLTVKGVQYTFSLSGGRALGAVFISLILEGLLFLLIVGCAVAALILF